MDEENFKLKMELDTNQFYKDLNKLEQITKKTENKDRKIRLFIDKNDFDQKTKDVLNAFDKMSISKSRLNLARTLFGNKNQYQAYAKIFNDIRFTAIDALNDIRSQSESLKLKLETENVTEANEKIKELESQLELLKQKASNYSWIDLPKDQLVNTLNDAIKLRKVLYGQRLTPIRLGDDKTAKELTERANALTTTINQMRDKLSGGLGISQNDLDTYTKLKSEMQAISTTLAKLKEQVTDGSIVNPEDEKKLQELKTEYDAILSDLQSNPLVVKMNSNTLKGMSTHIKQVLEHYKGVNKEARRMNLFTRIASSMFTRMRFQVVSLLNPFNRAKDIWQEFTYQNKEVGNTFSMIGKNFVRIMEPILMKITQWIVNAAGYADKFLLGLQKALGVEKPISLFDVDSLIEAERILQSMNDITAGFDELNTIGNLTDWEKWGVMKPTIDPEWENDLEKWGKTAGNILGWAMEHPLLTALGLIGGKWLLGLAGKGLVSLAGKAISKLFGGSAVANAAGSAGAAAGAKFGSFWSTTAGKVLKGGAGAALAVVGNVMVHDGVKNLTKYWNTMSTGEKVLRGLESAGGLAASTLGGALLGSVIPGIGTGIGAIIGFTVGATNAILTFGTTASDSILSVEDATQQYNNALLSQQQATANYNEALVNSANAMSQLQQLEEATGLSGKALAEQVDSGALSVDNMTASQMQVYAAYMQSKQAAEQLKQAEEAKKAADEAAIKSSIELALSNADTSKSYDELKDTVIQAWKEGKISTEDARTYFERAMGSMSKDARKTFSEDIPNEIKNGLDEDKYAPFLEKMCTNFKSVMGDLWKNLKKGWTDFWTWVGNGFKSNDTNKQVSSLSSSAQTVISGLSYNVPSYDVGTNYVPNDQLAMVHKGEAIIPAKYNTSFTGNSTDNSLLYRTIDNMNSEIASLRSIIQQGIPVTGQFVQRGNDLYAVVEKAKSKRGTQPISDASYAR